MIGHMGSHEWRSDTHPADRINALEARVKVLEDALEKIASIENRYNCGDWDEIEEARDIAQAALKMEKP